MSLGRPAAESPPTEVPASAEALFREHAPFVARLLAHLRVPADEIEDHVQEVFLVAHRKGGFLPRTGRATTWLARIAMNVAKTRRRSRGRRREAGGELLDQTASWDTGPENRAAAIEALARVQRALDVLDLEQRTLFVLFEIEGESCADIAAGLGVPIGTIYSRLHAARAAFVAAYDRDAPPPGGRKVQS